MLKRYIVVSCQSSVANGVSGKSQYSVDADSGLHAIVAFMRDCKGVSGNVMSFLTEGLNGNFEQVRLIDEKVLVLTYGNGQLFVLEPECEVVQRRLPF